MPKNKVSEYSPTASTLTQEYLKSILDYDLDTGIFTWKVSKANRTKVGDVAGWSYNGYREIEINNKAYKAHRLAWLYVYGEMPKNLVDHVDGNRSNNKISNLREATYQENSENYKTPKTNKSGVKNVYGQVNRINALTDPQTGLMVNIPRISVTVRISSLQSENLINNLDVSTTDITGDTITGKVINSKPDLTLGFITFEISEK
jgi:citrate synthase